MIYLILIIIFLLIISGLCRSLVHVLLHHFPAFDKKFNVDDFWFNPDISWRNKYLIKWTIKILSFKKIIFPIPVQVSDGFHFFNTVELIADFIREGIYAGFIAAAVFSFSFWPSFFIGTGWFLLTGVIKIIVVFNLGYNKIWK